MRFQILEVVQNSCFPRLKQLHQKVCGGNANPAEARKGNNLNGPYFVIACTRRTTHRPTRPRTTAPTTARTAPLTATAPTRTRTPTRRRTTPAPTPARTRTTGRLEINLNQLSKYSAISILKLISELFIQKVDSPIKVPDQYFHLRGVFAHFCFQN